MALPPAQPAYILRGHAAQIHSTAFIRSNTRLVTGDGDGWIVVWSLEIKRPVAVWRAHEGAILGADALDNDKLITHGKDNKLIIWKFSSEDEQSMSTVLPVDTPPTPRKQPWLLHVLHVNTMNFCSFAQSQAYPSHISDSDSSEDELLIAVPNTLSSETVDVFHIPSEKRIHTVPNTIKGGMIMAVSIFYHPITQNLTVVSGYESGHTSVSQLASTSASNPNPNSTNSNKNVPQDSKSQAQPSLLAQALKQTSLTPEPPKILQWQTLYLSQPHTQPVLSFSVSPKYDYYITSSADAIIAKHTIPTFPPLQTPSSNRLDLPTKTIQTGHSGQQSLVIRNDGKIFATAGWDSKIRVYSCKTLKELAMLKWHKEGCFAVGFADIVDEPEEKKEHGNGKDIVRREGGLSVREERARKAERTHWLVAGSKDGKVSLWDIY